MSIIRGERLVFPQKNGPDIELVVFGDEFYARYENTEGYSVVYDIDLKQYCYAQLIDGRFVSSGSPISKAAPSGIRKHLQESPAVRSAKFKNKYDKIRKSKRNGSDLRMRTLGLNSGLLEGRRVSSGKVKGLTIFVHFADLASFITKADIEALLNKENYHQNGNFCSVRDYFLKMSNGKLDYSSVVVGPIQLSKPRDYYIEHSFIPEALQLAIQKFQIDLSQFDSRQEGIVDALNFLYAGRTLYEGELWPHSSQVEFQHNGVRTDFYMLTSMGREPVDLSIGTFCHESGHQLCQLPDLYDYAERDDDNEQSEGIGVYCVMGSGNHLNNGRTPAPICAYLRYLLDWHSKEVLLNEPGSYQLNHGNYDTIFKYKTPKENEFFLAENRSQIEFDSYLPSSGLAVYHCDTMGSNEWQGGTALRHYQCALMQADGHLDMENARNTGDMGDLFAKKDGIAFSDSTTPASRLWDGSDSGLVLSDIGDPGQMISFTAGKLSAAKNAIEYCTKADIIIPDNSATGVSSVLLIDKKGKIAWLSAEVDITHRGIGDLQVELEAPSGKKITLHNRTGGKTNDIKKTFDSKTVLAPLVGESVQGAWKLTIHDLVKGNKGRLNAWKFTAECSALEKMAEGSASPNMEIPDNSRDGIDHAIEISPSGKASAIQVSFEIEHPYVGDLAVTLLSPSGKSVILHDMTGGSRRNLSSTYDSLTSKMLQPLLGEEIKGEWTIHAEDRLPQDTGKLMNWSITVWYA